MLCWALLLLGQPACSYGTMPDASQEGILKQYHSYEDIALFHYTVPPETTRATWEFASFQDEPDCPRCHFFPTGITLIQRASNVLVLKVKWMVII